VALLICFTGAFKAFDLFWVLLPNQDHTSIVSTLLVKEVIKFDNQGYGSTLAVILTVMVLLTVAAIMGAKSLWLRREKKDGSYDDLQGPPFRVTSDQGVVLSRTFFRARFSCRSPRRRSGERTEESGILRQRPSSPRPSPPSDGGEGCLWLRLHRAGTVQAGPASRLSLSANLRKTSHPLALRARRPAGHLPYLGPAPVHCGNARPDLEVEPLHEPPPLPPFGHPLPAEGERDGVREPLAGSWSQCMRKNEWGLPMNQQVGRAVLSPPEERGAVTIPRPAARQSASQL